MRLSGRTVNKLPAVLLRRTAQLSRWMRIHSFSFLIIAQGCASMGAPNEPWFNPPGGSWIPDAATVTLIKIAVNRRLGGALADKARTSGPPVHYWFQYRGDKDGADQTIEVVGFPNPVDPGASGEFLDVWVPENCVISATYSPRDGKLTRFGVGGVACPPRL